MLKMDIINAVAPCIGVVQEVLPLENGFSPDQKYKVTAETGVYLVRVSSSASFSSKQEAFLLMRSLHTQGVRCNQPVALFQDDARRGVYGIYHFLPGTDAAASITHYATETQYEMGKAAGEDLRRINHLRGTTRNWKARKWQKHQSYVQKYFEQDYRFRHDDRVLRFIERNYDDTEEEADFLQHDDFHLANLIVHEGQYAGVIDFDRYDWGDPLHEFVKLEWFTWPVSEAFARGQGAGYFGAKGIDDAACLQFCVYLAMSIFSSIVWTLNHHPDTWPFMENRMCSILERYDYFDCVRPAWAL